MKLKFFASISDAVEYMTREVLSTLRSDLSRMNFVRRDFFTDEDREEMRARIADLKQIIPAVMAAFAEPEAPKQPEPFAAPEAEQGYVVEYTLPYTHRVQVGVYAPNAESASKKAESAFDAGTIWDNTPEMPLLFDDFEEDGNAGVALEFSVVSKGCLPAPDGSVLVEKRNARARSCLKAVAEMRIAAAMQIAKE